MFCLPGYILPELEKRFGLIRLDESLRSRDAVEFATPAAEHLSELNAIHPFREGNGRTQLAFLIVLAKQAGLEISIRQIDPEAWNHASRESFRTGDAATLREVILGAIGFKKCPPKPTAAS